MRLVQTSFDESASVHAGRRVPLEIDHVAYLLVGSSAEEVVLCDFVQSRRRSECGNMSADAVEVLVTSNNHRHGIPADDTFDATFNFQITRKSRLLRMMNRVDIRSIRCERQLNAVFVGAFLQLNQQFAKFLCSIAMQNVIQGVVPLLHFFGVNAGNCVKHSLIDHQLPLW